MHRRGLLAQTNVALGHEVDSHTVFNYLLQCSDAADALKVAGDNADENVVVNHVVADMTENLAIQLQQLLRLSGSKPEELMASLLGKKE